LLSKASEKIYSNKDKEEIRLEEAENPEEVFKNLFGTDVFEGR